LDKGIKNSGVRALGIKVFVVSVWAAEGFENSRKLFDPSESLRQLYIRVGKWSSTPKNVQLRVTFLLPPSLLGIPQHKLGPCKELLAP
jgi:hypothetical protein